MLISNSIERPNHVWAETWECLIDDEFGFMFSPNVESLLEALQAVVKEGKERLARRGKACREYAISMFTATKMALAYERLFLCIKEDRFCNYP